MHHIIPPQLFLREKVTVGHEPYHNERCGAQVHEHGSRAQELEVALNEKKHEGCTLWVAASYGREIH